jgi:sigma-B regulation protein RsbU (phosphoserine phosphatase)
MMPENDLHRSLEIHKGLVEVSALINGITNREALLREVLDVARRVIAAEAASIFLLEEESGNLRLEMDARGGGWVERPGIVVPRGAGIAGWVFETGKAQLIPDAYAEARFFKEADKVTGFRTRSILCAPLIAGGRTIGVLQVLNPAAKGAFDAVELEGLVAHANLAATAIGKLQALERERERERLERDLAVAAEIQSELLARAIPQTLSGVVFAAHNVPAAWVGGDFYGVFPRGDGDVDFVIGDVSGKGMPAALLMAQTLSALPFVFQAAGGPAEALGMLNRTFSEGMVRGMFITVLAGRMRPSRREVMLASAGHPAPVVVDAIGVAGEFGIPVGLPVGITPQVDYPNSAVRLDVGGRVVCFTDGLAESRAAASGCHFQDRMLSEISGPPDTCVGMMRRVVEAEGRHRGGMALRDDLTVLVGAFE